VLRNAVKGRTGFINFGMDSRPLHFFHHHIEGVRNLTLPDEQLQKLGPINFGRVVTWRQNMDARFSLNRGAWLSPTFGWTSAYNQDNRPELSKDLSVRALERAEPDGIVGAAVRPGSERRAAPRRTRARCAVPGRAVARPARPGHRHRGGATSSGYRARGTSTSTWWGSDNPGSSRMAAAACRRA
jgi:hypothetical protein